ncbi:PilZ domain-containing protein [Sphingobium sp. WCS2017Hpa-17]|uniref:PilZ domain-containing protein n=1 Tax=Sphingobium sp. WCS2017Hpa-17 TaxID=3073638 RepID=UPI0028896B30|nr:PilZ domain-containing protein [Sphingobium sp. WCS2017Hpa-17]
MSIHARLLMNRRAADRVEADHASTILRDAAHDVVIHDLSCTGCRVSVDPAPLVGEAVIIDLPGIGICPAQVIWVRDGGAGLSFDRMLTDHDLGLLRAADRPAQSSVPDAAVPADRPLSPLRRLGIIIAAGICAWCIAILLVWMVMRLV